MIRMYNKKELNKPWTLIPVSPNRLRNGEVVGVKKIIMAEMIMPPFCIFNLLSECLQLLISKFFMSSYHMFYRRYAALYVRKMIN